MSADALRLYGTIQPVPEERLLRAGPLSAILTVLIRAQPIRK